MPVEHCGHAAQRLGVVGRVRQVNRYDSGRRNWRKCFAEFFSYESINNMCFRPFRRRHFDTVAVGVGGCGRGVRPRTMRVLMMMMMITYVVFLLFVHSRRKTIGTWNMTISLTLYWKWKMNLLHSTSCPLTTSYRAEPPHRGPMITLRAAAPHARTVVRYTLPVLLYWNVNHQIFNLKVLILEQCLFFTKAK